MLSKLILYYLLNEQFVCKSGIFQTFMFRKLLANAESRLHKPRVLCVGDENGFLN